jgi:SAM-dependent methyltransferase
MGGRASEDVREFFTRRAPALLAGDPALPREAHGRCRFDVTDAAGHSGTWVVDVTVDPPRIREGAPDRGDCCIDVAAEDLAAMVDDPLAGQVLVWQGRLRMGGDQALLRRVSSTLFPLPAGDNGAYAGYYAALSRLVPDARLAFMNHGYAGAEDPADETLAEEDRPWARCIALIRRVLDDAPVADGRVLDVGCGRGGPAEWIARTRGAREVVGLDASADAVELCRRQRRHPALRFVHGHADRLPRPDGSVDVVLNVESSHCYPDRARFFAEVARVLRAGGAFCYADIVRGDELEGIRAGLAATPALRALREADITAEVARGIERNRETLAGVLRAATDLERRNAAIINHLIRSINDEIHDHYVSGRWRYHTWRMEKSHA